MKLGIIQSRGIGDILIALPIAKKFYDEGHQIFWPIQEDFVSSFMDTVPWVNWIPLEVDQKGLFFFDRPLAILEKSVDQIICLYQHLSNEPRFMAQPNIQARLKFDQYKYAITNVPFLEKWNLASCLTRNTARELDLYEKIVKQDKYFVLHQDGSTYTGNFDLPREIVDEMQLIKIEPLTDCIFDWLTILEKSSGLALIDSSFANLVDQLGICSNVIKIFGFRSNPQLTPVLGGNWVYVG